MITKFGIRKAGPTVRKQEPGITLCSCSVTSSTGTTDVPGSFVMVIQLMTVFQCTWKNTMFMNVTKSKEGLSNCFLVVTLILFQF